MLRLLTLSLLVGCSHDPIEVKIQERDEIVIQIDIQLKEAQTRINRLRLNKGK